MTTTLPYVMCHKGLCPFKSYPFQLLIFVFQTLLKLLCVRFKNVKIWHPLLVVT